MVVPPGVDLPPPPPRGAARRALVLPEDAPVVAFVARLTRVKRPDRFLDVAHRLRQMRPDVLFVVAGEGDELDATRTRAAELGLDGCVRFLGWRGDVEVEVIYSAADVTLLTSDNEGMPLSLIEAAMCGCPAVTTDVGSAGEVVLDGLTGLVAEPDTDALATAVEAILADDELATRLGAGAKHHSHNEFSRPRLVEHLSALYETVVAELGLACTHS